MKIHSFHLGLVALFLIGSAAQAEQIYTYTLDLPTIVNGAEVDSVMIQYSFSWVGPYMYNAGPNTACPTVCGPVVPGSTVEPGYSFAGFDFTADLALSDAEAQINFSNDLNPGNTIVFSFIEPDSFWTQQGNNISFTSVDGTGASYEMGGPDPACTGCTVSISQSGAVPEPRSFALIAGVLLLFGSLRPRKAAKPIS